MAEPLAPGAEGGCQRPVPFGFPAYTKRALIVAPDATRRDHAMHWCHNKGYLAMGCSNPVAATAMLRYGTERFYLVVFDAVPSCVGSMELLRCAVSEMRLCVYGVSKSGYLWGPLDEEALDIVDPTIMGQTVNKSTLWEPTPRSKCNSLSNTATTNSQSEKQSSDAENREVDQNNDGHKPKKDRLVWTPELHKKFEYAYNKLSPEDAVPKKILIEMNDARLTRENIASHLQKYRMYLNAKQLEPDATPPQTSIIHPSESDKSVIKAPMTDNIIQNNHQELHVQVFDDVNISKECIGSTVDPGDELTRYVTPNEMYTGAQDKEHGTSWDQTYLIRGVD